MAGGISIAVGVSEIVPTVSQLTGTLTASAGGTGLTSLAAGYVPVGNGTTTLTAVPFGQRLIAYSSGVLLTTSGDQLLTMAATSGQVIPRRVTIANPAVSIATIIAVCTVRTATGGGGSALTGSVVFTGLSATTAFLDQTVLLASGTFSATSNICVQVTTAIGLASQTLPVTVYGDIVFP